MTARIPWTERKTPWRGALDLATGAYPLFVFGGPVGHALPVFHFHEVTPSHLEPYLRYLDENGYRTVTADAVSSWVRGGMHPGPRSVVLCFDDAWASVWTVAAPLLRKYAFQGVTFAIPGRVKDAAAVRPTIDDPAGAPAGVDASDVPFATWPELRALQDSGVVDVQAHTFAHAVVACAAEIEGFVAPGYAPHIHMRPGLSGPPEARFLGPDDLGAPLHPVRSRMSDALRYDDAAAREACMTRVREQGGAAFFQRQGWESELRALAAAHPGRTETEEEREAAILEDLDECREVLNAKLRTRGVRHLCFPWAIAGRVAERCAERAGYDTAYADAVVGLHAVRAGGNPYRLMRLKHKFIYALPGAGRRTFVQLFRSS